MNISFSKHTAVPVYPTRMDIPLNQTGIPQADISRHLHSYPGLDSVLVGLRILLQASTETCSLRTPADVLFRVRNFEEFREMVGLLQSKEMTQESLRPMFLSKPLQIEIVQDMALFQEKLLSRSHNNLCQCPQGQGAESEKNDHEDQRKTREV